MRQVLSSEDGDGHPVGAKSAPIYGILGDGRLSQHLQQYFAQLRLDFWVWSRNDERDLDIMGGRCDVYLLAVSDSAIESVATAVQAMDPDIPRVHFSGALSTPLASAWHPLMTFSSELYELSTYQAIPFIGETGGKDFSELFPALKNPHQVIAPEQRALYHALCVIAGNFSQLLWTKTAETFTKDLNLPLDFLKPYLQACLDNFFTAAPDVASALTGPFRRNDYRTISQHLETLQNDAYLGVYKAFLKTYGEEHEDFRFPEIQI